jgi:ribosome-binding protein aMBF1 (putative translation factor)
MKGETVERKREFRKATPEERERLKQARAEADAELPDMLERAARRRQAMAEQNVSGQLRRAIAEDGWRYEELSAQAGITVAELADFMTGDVALPSTAVDRLAELVHQKLVTAE